MRKGTALKFMAPIRSLGLVTLVGVVGLGSLRAESLLEPDDVVAICGDSITRQSVYSVYLETYLLACQPALPIRTVQGGWGGMTASRFVGKMESGVQTFSPTVATTCYGMNDGRYDHLSEEVAETYRESLATIVDQFREGGVRTMILGGPGAVDTFTFRNPKTAISAEEYNHTLGQLSAIAGEVAAEKGVIFADLHRTMMEVMARAKESMGDSYPVSGPTDGVHAGPNGHLIMTYAFLKAMGVQGEIGTLRLDLSSGEGFASEGHRVVRSSQNELEVESARYPFCFVRGSDGRVDSVTSILPFLPFNEELNRFIFRVEGLQTDSARVTWGKESKEFTAAELEAGINLAAEFLENPFTGAFRKLDAAVSTQQRFEIFYLKDFEGENRPQIEKSVPDTVPALARVGEALRELDDQLAGFSSSKVVPVTHLLQVDPVE
ncbi:MAG: SGNH/GDSL hydrolase family protein [Puniceicoccales bacterium]